MGHTVCDVYISLFILCVQGADWVDPDDPMLIAENELLGAAESIDKAARKLASLKPRKEVKGKVGIVPILTVGFFSCLFEV